jgi:uncharacterized iron-regulated membrane protein/flavodoxin
VKTLRKIIFWSHLLAGVTAGLVIFSMSLTGVILMYEPQIGEYAEARARQVAPGARRLGLDELLVKVRDAYPAGRPAMILLKSDPAASVAVNLGRDNTVFVNPYTGEILGEQSAIRNFLRDVVDWHRWLGVEGEDRATARAITGACNLAFLWLAVTGVYLWWPPSWHWRALKHSFFFSPRLRGKAHDWNWHNVIGFWSSSVLVILTLTAAVMSYPWANDLLYTLTGSEPPPRTQNAGPAAPNPRRARVTSDSEARAAKPVASFDALWARAERQVPGWVMIMLRFAPRGDAPVIASIQGPDAFHPFQRSQLTLDRATAEVIKWEPYASNSTGRKARTWVRALHTGEAFGFAGQTVAGLASLGGCFLVWTGLAMAWRRFRYRKRNAEDKQTIEYALPTKGSDPIVQVNVPITNKASEELAKTNMDATNFYTTNGHARNGHADAGIEWTAETSKGKSVLILYGTVTGTAEILANKLAAKLRSAGIATAVRDMAHCQVNILTQANCVLMVVSTYGDGEPPDDAAPFWQAVVHANRLDLSDLNYSVLALGNTTFDQFCKCGRDFDSALERHGANRIYPRVDCDIDYETPARRWLDGVLAHLAQDSRVLSA